MREEQVNVKRQQRRSRAEAEQLVDAFEASGLRRREFCLVLVTLQDAEVRTYISEKKQAGRRDWEGKAEQQQYILKRLLIHVGAFNLSLIFRKRLGSGTPRELRNRQSLLFFVFLCLFRCTSASVRHRNSSLATSRLNWHRNHRYLRYKIRHSGKQDSATDC